MFFTGRRPRFPCCGCYEIPRLGISHLVLLLSTKGICSLPPHFDVVPRPSLHVVHADVLSNSELLMWSEVDARLWLQLQLGALVVVN
jgi:hypothetical protein